MTDHMKTLRELVALIDERCLDQDVTTGLEIGNTAANARPALAALLREIDDLRAVADEVNNVYGLIKDNPMFRRLVEAFDAVLRDLETKETEDA